MNSGASILVIPWTAGRSIKLKDRNIDMIKQELILRHPLGHLGLETEEILPAGKFGAVLAHAGIGKTALLVQLALNSMLRGRNVLHVSLQDPVNKVTLWYGELFNHLASRLEGAQVGRLWDAILPHRFIMTFRVESFTVPKLEERLNDITEQWIFKPEMMIIDGFHFDAPMRPALVSLKTLALRHGMHVWFTVHAHSNEKPDRDGLHPSFQPFSDLFDLILALHAERANVHIKAIRGLSSASATADLLLDPSTMLIKNDS